MQWVERISKFTFGQILWLFEIRPQFAIFVALFDITLFMCFSNFCSLSDLTHSFENKNWFLHKIQHIPPSPDPSYCLWCIWRQFHICNPSYFFPSYSIQSRYRHEIFLKFIKIIVHRNSIIREQFHKTKNKNYKIYHSIFITYTLKGLYFLKNIYFWIYYFHSTLFIYLCKGNS